MTMTPTTAEEPLPSPRRYPTLQPLRPHRPGSGPGVPGRHYLATMARTAQWGRLPCAVDEPVLRVRPGETVTIDTVSHEGLLEDQGRDPLAFFAAHGVARLDVLADAVEIARDSPHDPAVDGPHVVTGPIAVSGARPGDLLAVTILELTPRVPYGVISNRHGSGALPGEMPEGPGNVSVFTQVEGTGPAAMGTLPLTGPVAGGCAGARGASGAHGASRVPGASGALWAPRAPAAPGALAALGAPAVPDAPSVLSTSVAPIPRVRFPLRPFLGITGVATAGDHRTHSVPPGLQGGNLDISLLVEGTTLYLPVAVEEALAYVGDPHFAQGNGEVSLTALEASLRATLRFDIVPAATARRTFGKVRGPLIETDSLLVPTGLDPDLDTAVANCVRNALELLTARYGMDRHLAYAYLSAATDFDISQVVDGVKGSHARIRKSDFAALGNPDDPDGHSPGG